MKSTAKDKARRRYMAPVEIRRQTGEPLVNRAKAAAILGISVSELKRREDNGLYPSLVDAKGWHWYGERMMREIAATGGEMAVDPRESGATSDRRPREHDQPPLAVRSAPRTFSAQVAKDVFVDLEAGKQPIEIVITRGVHPEIFEAIREAFARLKGGFFLSETQRVAIERLPIQGAVPIQSGEQLVAILQQSLRSRPCAACRRGFARFCGDCMSAQKSAAEADWLGAAVGLGGHAGPTNHEAPVPNDLRRNGPTAPATTKSEASGGTTEGGTTRSEERGELEAPWHVGTRIPSP